MPGSEEPGEEGEIKSGGDLEKTPSDVADIENVEKTDVDTGTGT